MPFPDGVFVTEEDWHLSQPATETGATFAGQGQRIVSPTAYWVAGFRVMITREVEQAWRAWVTARRGIAVPDTMLPHSFNAPTAAEFQDDGGWDDGTLWDDGTGWVIEASGAVEVIAAAPAGTTVVTVRRTGGASEYAAGQYCGFRGQLYRIEATQALDANDARLEIWPPLRRELTTETKLQTPRTKMRLADPQQGRIPDLSSIRAIEITVDMVEIL